MGYYAIIGGEQQVPLASISGWHDFKEWAAGLAVAHYPEIAHLCDHAWGELPQLTNEIKAALVDQPPEDPTVADTARSLMQNLVAAPVDAETMFVSDGTTDQDVADDWHSEAE